MTSTDFAPSARSAQIPHIGARARALFADRANLPLYAVLVVALLWGASTFAFGLPGLYLPAVVLSPMMVALLVLISRG